jgi:hypothetical protein
MTASTPSAGARPTVRACTGWTPIPVPEPEDGGALLAVTAISDTEAWAVGGAGIRELPRTPLIEHWNGSAWTMVPSPNAPGGQLFGASGTSATDVWAVGSYPALPQRPLAEHWDGSAWSIVTTAVSDDAALNDVVAIAPDDVWAVGFSPTGLFRPFAQHWDGSTWTVSSLPLPPNALGSLSAVSAGSSTDVWVAGAIQHDPGSNADSLVARWTGRRGSGSSSRPPRTTTTCWTW